MKHGLRKIYLSAPAAIFITVLFASMHANAAGTESGYQLLADIPTIGKTTGITLIDYMKGIFVATIGLAIVLAVIEIVIGGIEYVAAAVPSSKEDAKKRIGGAVGGLLLILLAYVLLKALNPALLNVGLNLEDISMVVGADGGVAPQIQQQYCLNNGATGQTFDTLQECKDAYPQMADGCGVCGGGGGPLNCTTGKCATNGAVANAVQNNSSGVNPNIVMSIIDGGEGCNKGTSSAGACGYSQVVPQYRRTVCGLTGTNAETCAAMQNDVNVDINCGAKFLKTEFIPSCGPSITLIAACYNAGPHAAKAGSCGQQNYCQRVTNYYNTCN